MTHHKPTRTDHLSQMLLDRYEIGPEIGRGGFGKVYAARHLFLHRKVAIKVLDEKRVDDRDSVERFLREARAADAIGSPHITKVIDCGMSPDGQPFIAMELLEGESLRQLVKREAPLTLELSLSFGVQILEGLADAHRSGIVHRDLKPANIFVCHVEEGEPFLKILDFGASKIHSSTLTDSLTLTGMWLGTAAYSAPEQFKDARSVDHKADLYSTAAILFEMLSGQQTLNKAPLPTMAYLIKKGKIRRLRDVAPELPQHVVDVVERGLALDPSNRWGDALEFARALQGALATAPKLATVAASRELPIDIANVNASIAAQTTAPVAQMGSSTAPLAQPPQQHQKGPKRKTPRWVFALAILCGLPIALMFLFTLTAVFYSLIAARRSDQYIEEAMQQQRDLNESFLQLQKRRSPPTSTKQGFSQCKARCGYEFAGCAGDIASTEQNILEACGFSLGRCYRSCVSENPNPPSRPEFDCGSDCSLWNNQCLLDSRLASGPACYVIARGCSQGCLSE